MGHKIKIQMTDSYDFFDKGYETADGFLSYEEAVQQCQQIIDKNLKGCLMEEIGKMPKKIKKQGKNNQINYLCSHAWSLYMAFGDKPSITGKNPEGPAFDSRSYAHGKLLTLCENAIPKT